MLCILLYVLAAGTSPLGDMPNPSELASLNLPLAPGGEDPLTTVAGSTSSASGSDPCKAVPSGATHSAPASTPAGVSSNSAQSTEFSLGLGFPLIPQKLVTKILKWEFVSMAELLPDNIDLSRRSGEVQKACSSKAPKKRELTEDWKGLIAWSVSFSTFTAIIAREHPEKFKELLAYHATILIEALRFGCKGWLSYDKLSREHIEKDPSTSWSMLHPMFYSLSFLSQRVEALTCPRCMAPDHGKSECALSTLEPEPAAAREQPSRIRQTDTSAGRQSGPPRKRFRREGTPTSQAAPKICFSYNEGLCFRHPKPCDREHKCIRCGKDHRMVDCKASFVPATT